MRKLLKITIITITMMLLVSLTACSGSEESDTETIRIMNKNYTEQRLLGEMMSVYIQSLGYETELTELGGTMLVFEALNSGAGDLYAEYTGTAYGAVLSESEILSRQETYDFVSDVYMEEYGLTWLGQFGFNNTYVLSVTQETVDKYGITTISDLAKVSGELTIGSDSEFPNRSDGLPGLMERYEGLEFKDVKSMDQGLLYAALDNDEIQVIVAYATEGKLAKYNLINLEDDLSFFPPYDCAPIMKKEFADAHPDIVEALNRLEGAYGDADMQSYNLMVDEGKNVTEVAEMMLRDKGFIE